MSLKNKLNRFKAQMIRDEQTSMNRFESPSNLTTMNLPFSEEWEKANVTPYFYENEYCLIREIRYPLEYKHGNYQLKDFLEAIQIWENFKGTHPLSAKGMSPTSLFFFDTETTGLYGGAGNTIFLLGHAQLQNNEIILKQHFLPEPGLEVALYKSFLETVDYKTLVTYNGKAFDWPQVKTRHTLVRDHVPKLPAFGHFDLYHAARRLWKDQLESVKLANVEKEIIGVTREDDVPGYLAPMIYFDFVERKNPEAIIKVMEHNEIDILSLITLYTHLTFQILSLDPKQTTTEKMLVGKWFHYIGEKELAQVNFKEAANEGDLAAKHQLAFHLKRAGKYIEAMEMWTDVIQIESPSIQKVAFVELSKLMEHQFKDINKALHYAKQADILHSAQKIKANPINQRDPFSRELKKRIARLLRKY